MRASKYQRVRRWFRRILSSNRRRLPAKPPSSQRSGRELSRQVLTTVIGTDVTPEQIAAAFIAAELGYPREQCELIDAVNRPDGVARTLYKGRRTDVSGRTWTIVPGGKQDADVAAAEMLGAAMRDVPRFSAMVGHLVGSLAYGYAASEVIWKFDRRVGKIVPERFENVSPRQFNIVDNELRLATNDSPWGEPLMPGSWVTMVQDGDEELGCRALGRTTVLLSVLKILSIRNWVGFVQRFGIPFVQATVEQYHDQASRRVAQEMVAAFGDDGGAVLPDGVKTEIHDGGRSDGEVHGSLLAYLDDQLRSAILGVTLTTSSGGTTGTHALGRVHGNKEWRAIQSDAAAVADTLQECVSVPFMHFNGLAGNPPRWVFHVVPNLAPSDVAGVIDDAVNNLGLDVSEGQTRELLGLRKPSSAQDTLPGRTAKVAA